MVRMPVELGKIREYASATGNVRRDYRTGDRPAVPPTFLSTVVFWDSLDDVFEAPQARHAFAAAGVDPGVRRLLSLEQEYVFFGPPPTAGDVLRIGHRFDGITVKEGRRGGRMLLVRFTATFVGDGADAGVGEGAGADRPRAECRYTSAILTGPTIAPDVAFGPGAPAAAEPLPSDGELPERWFGPLTMTDIVRYQGASGDLNPMHHDDELARGAGYPQAFGVGMLGAGYLATWATDQFGTHTARRFRTRFQELMWRGDRLRAGGRIVREFEVDGEKRREIDLTLRAATGVPAIRAQAEFAITA